MVVSGFGIGAFFYSEICTHIVNPENEVYVDFDPIVNEKYFSPVVNHRVPLMF